MTKFLNISVDNTLGGNSPSDVAVSSQKAVKEYVDAHSGGSVSVDDITINRDSNQKLQAIGLINKNEVSGATSPIYDWVGTRAEWEDGSQSTWYCWENSNLTWSTQTLSYNAGWYKCAQSDTTLAFIDAADNRIAYTTDGDNWSYSSISSGSSYYGFVYGNGKFIACGNGSTNCKYSSDLSSWASVTLPVSGNWNGGVYTGSMFLIPGGNNYITSADGISWTARTFPNSLGVKNVAFGNGIFVAVASGNILTSTDGETWIVTAKAGLADSSVVLYRNGKFVIGTYDNTYDVYYSTDGLNWSTTTSATNKYWESGCFGNGVFLLRAYNQYNYSLDGIKWFSVSSNLSDERAIAYFADKFICAGYFSNTIEKSSFTSTSQYTLDASPTTSSDLYSAVETPSSLTITSVGTGYISLSDGYDYYYNSDGNQFTYRSIGDIHPNWLCYILGDSLKLGTTTIADISSGRNIGEIIQSTIPLTDAGLHLLDGSLINGAGSYSAFVTHMANLYSSLEKVSNIGKVGKLADNSGIISGFSSSKYLKFYSGFSPSSNTWEYVIKIRLTSIPTYNALIDNPINYGGFKLYLDSGSLRLNLSSNGSAWDISSANAGSLTLSTNTDYWIKTVFDGSRYVVSYSTDGTNYTTDITVTSSTPIFQGSVQRLGIDNNLSYPLTGSLDLNESYININGSRWWTGEQPQCFTDESIWQGLVSTYGVCGKFVYDSVNNTVRLPKYSNKIYTSAIATTAGVKGNGKTLGLTDGTTTAGLNGNRYVSSTHYGLTSTGSAGTAVGTTGAGTGALANNVFAGITTDATKSGIIADLSNITTALDGYYYIVIANSTKTNIEVDIDEVMTDLNSKSDVDLTNVNASGTSLASGWAMPSTRYIDLTLGATNTNYQAPANGYVFLQKASTASGQIVALYNRNEYNTANISQIQSIATASGQYPAVILAVKKGKYFRAGYTAAGTSTFFRFIYAEGEPNV